MSYLIVFASEQQVKQQSSGRLIGTWQRTDGGYRIVVQKVKQDGMLDVMYYNPNIINVSQARFMEKNGKLSVAIELRDIGYPGSTYALTYSSNNDALTGEYFHAGLNRTFDVIFLRKKD